MYCYLITLFQTCWDTLYHRNFFQIYEFWLGIPILGAPYFDVNQKTELGDSSISITSILYDVNSFPEKEVDAIIIDDSIILTSTNYVN